MISRDKRQEREHQVAGAWQAARRRHTSERWRHRPRRCGRASATQPWLPALWRVRCMAARRTRELEGRGPPCRLRPAAVGRSSMVWLCDSLGGSQEDARFRFVAIVVDTLVSGFRASGLCPLEAHDRASSALDPSDWRAAMYRAPDGHKQPAISLSSRRRAPAVFAARNLSRVLVPASPYVAVAVLACIQKRVMKAGN